MAKISKWLNRLGNRTGTTLLTDFVAIVFSDISFVHFSPSAEMNELNEIDDRERDEYSVTWEPDAESKGSN